MATRLTVTCILIIISVTSSQVLRQYSNNTLKNQGICRSRVYATLKGFYNYYKDCIVVIGNLQLSLLEKTRTQDFVDISFPNLREITEFIVFYRVNGLISLGQLFPNLARIRGERLLNNYGLIIHDMSSLKEIGLYGLFKIDRGGVVIWGAQKACFIESVDWESIAPHSYRAISPEDKTAHCNFPCTCSLSTAFNHCWSNIKCQIFLEGKEADKCHDLCLGCRKTRSDVCTLCRHFTHNGRCVTSCPSNTILLPDSQYCVTNEECISLDGWIWNNKCVFHCPIDYVEEHTTKGTTCVFHPNVNVICQNLNVKSLSSLQEAERCVIVKGSLVIHIRPVQEEILMPELTKYLSRIQEVSDYIAIYSSATITSLDFLPSLKRIKGKKLKDNKYSLIIRDMTNLQTLFTSEVTNMLKINKGTLKMYNNPTLCTSQIEMIKPLFPVQPNDNEVPPGMNGYSGNCEEVSVGFQIRSVNETSVAIMFSAKADPYAHYSVLYVRLPPDIPQNLVPESCSESEWYVVNAETGYGHQTPVIELTSLHPASTYAICIETYDIVNRKLSRSNIVHFTTPVGIPEPPFIRQLSAFNSSAVDIRWVDHKDYLPFITHYELEVSLIEIYDKDIAVKDQCKHFEYAISDMARHAVVMRPPPDYAKSCESVFGISSIASKVSVEEYFDVCGIIGCDNLEDKARSNSTFGRYAKSLYFNITAPRKEFTVVGLAPFRDYRFKLRSCTREECSRSARGVVRTLHLENADVPSIRHVKSDEHGYISIQWEPPELTNGPILSYLIEVASENNDTIGFHRPQAWCVLANETKTNIKLVKANNYSVRVCARSMASDGACANWKSVEIVTAVPPVPMWWWTGVIFGVCLCFISVIAGIMVKRRSESIELVPIMELSICEGESEPPSKMLTNFAPIMYSIPLRETQLE